MGRGSTKVAVQNAAGQIKSESVAQVFCEQSFFRVLCGASARWPRCSWWNRTSGIEALQRGRQKVELNSVTQVWSRSAQDYEVSIWPAQAERGLAWVWAPHFKWICQQLKYSFALNRLCGTQQRLQWRTLKLLSTESTFQAPCEAEHTWMNAQHLCGRLYSTNRNGQTVTICF